MSSFISAALGLIVVFLMAAGAVYSVMRIYRALKTDPVIVAEQARAAATSGGSQRARNSMDQTPRTRAQHPVTEPNQSKLPKMASSDVENDEEPVPVIFRKPAA